MSRADDTELVKQCINGDRQAFESLLVKYQKPVFNAAYRMLHSAEDAKDVTQTVFLKVYENLDKYDPKHRFFSWIYRIAMNESIDCLGRINRTEPIEDELEDQGRGPELETDGELLKSQLQAALMNVKPEYRTVIVLKHFLECSYEEIGEILAIPEKTVKSRLYTGRQLLKDLLTGRDVH
ncbi:MAG: sigma-70 family RNA polymerase sigma factor [Gammaproteobacteria bacterium]|nr:sigma-70 family RNA polymerase sigma factor [Gammaproteobacteria bacterium]MDH4316165.1 sigma-70 family RNA polymerase sigma factor [Gammaproteobacteria bacterium]MDH5213314.1 sigma-70 family RNA polymerase sigma factor [Gammaproteobacteria bacterium]MDH5501476.1 sigma-70 family RNA polymerase sigma factor [Gammaproteobacteria bacterium]